MRQPVRLRLVIASLLIAASAIPNLGFEFNTFGFYWTFYRIVVVFLALITLGYVAGIAAKFVGGNVNWGLAVYLINLTALVVNGLVFARNKSLDAKRRAARA